MSIKSSLKNVLSICVLLLVIAGVGAVSVAGETIDLSDAVIVSTNEPRIVKAADFLADEIEIRSGIRPGLSQSIPNDVPVIFLGDVNDFPVPYILPAGLNEPEHAEGYTIWLDDSARQAKVYLLGTDERGALFAAGRLIRLLSLSRGYIELDKETKLEDWPRMPLRGHQIAYRSLNNTNDAWTTKQYEQYIRDLIIFGTNSFEFIPLLDLNTVDGPHSIMSTGAMDTAISQMLDEYGLDMWLWKAIYQSELDTPEEYEATLAKWRAVFDSLPRLNGMFVPGADGGDLTVQQMMEWLSRLYPVLKASHPKAKLWVSNQGWSQAENEWFFDYAATNEPNFLQGVVYGPWAEITLPQLRAGTPAQYKLRRYPDITHSMASQYPVYKWDRAFLHTLGRECINPRPWGTSSIYKAFDQYSDGFITYSDGVHDDLNKIIWSALGWDPNTDVNDILYEYGKVFFAYDSREDAIKADFNHDYKIDATDMNEMASDWLDSDSYEYTTAGTAPDNNRLLLWYKFDETSGYQAFDSSGRNLTGTIDGKNNWDADGYDGKGCLSFNDDTAISVPTEVLSSIDQHITVSVWLYGYASAEADGTRRDNFVFDTGSGDFFLTAKVPDIPENVTFRAGYDPADVLTWYDSNSADWEEQWRHYAFVKLGGTLRIYRDGYMVAEKTGTTWSVSNLRNAPFDIGAAIPHVNDYKGKMDDFRIYDYPLTDDEVLYLAKTRAFYTPLDSQADIYKDGKIDFRDYALLADQWLRDYRDNSAQWVEDIAQQVAAGLIKLEKNWTGLLAENEGVEDTLALWRSIAAAHDEHSVRNWRLEMYLFRAMYDAYLQRKLFYEMDYEKQANEALLRAFLDGSDAAIANATAALDQIDTLPPEVQELRDQIEQLGLKLFEDIGIQLSTKAPYFGHSSTRGCVLDWMDFPLNNRRWLEDIRFPAILAEPNEWDRLSLIYQTVYWQQPTPDAIYDDLGGANESEHLVRQKPWEEDPGGMEAPIYDGYYSMNADERLSQLDNIETRYGAPLMMRYEGLDTTAQYTLRVTYAGRYNATTTLTADGVYQIHGPLKQPNPLTPVEFSIPQAATADGILQLQWDLVSGRGIQLGEIWLIKQ